MTFRLSTRSRQRLEGVHPDLVRVVERALSLSSVDFMVTEGLRSRTRQAALFRAGASRTLRSRHLTGHAVDVAAIVEGRIRWDWPLYEKIGVAFAKASSALDVPVVWGGTWPGLRDGPHFELDRKAYP